MVNLNDGKFMYNCQKTFKVARFDIISYISFKEH